MRVFSKSEWAEVEKRIFALAEKLPRIQRSPLEQQGGKSRVKRFILYKKYGPTGQP